MAIQVKNVQKVFSQTDRPLNVLENINLTINDGEFVSCLGPSGCGKSTLLNIIAGLETQTSGEVLVDGHPVTGPGTDRVMVFQEAALFPWLSVLDNVMFGLKIKGQSRKAATELAHEYLKMVHLSRFIHSFPHELSGGMRQRVAIARALVMNPNYLLMDEPFGALDEQTKLVLHADLQEIWVKNRKTIVFVTHNIREAVKLSDRVIILGTRPGNIKKEFKVQFSRPRAEGDKNLVHLENLILEELREEIEKVIREEADSDYNFTPGRIPWNPDRDLGSNI